MQDEKFEILTQKAVSKVKERIQRMETKVKLAAWKKIEDFEKVSKDKSKSQIDALIKAQNLVAQAVSADMTNQPTKIDPQNNPYMGKPTLAKDSAEVLRKSEKEVAKYKDKILEKAKDRVQELSRRINADEMDKLSREKGNSKERQSKVTTLKRQMDTKIRRSQRRLKRAQRKAARSGSKIDKVKIERARNADDSAKRAARGVLEASNIARGKRERAEKHRKVQNMRTKARKAGRRAARELEKAATSGSTTRLKLATERLQQAKTLSKKATEAEIDQVKQNGLHAYEQALHAGGSPEGGGPILTSTDESLRHLTDLIHKAKRSKKKSDYAVAKEYLANTELTMEHASRSAQRKALRKHMRNTDKWHKAMKVAQEKFTKSRHGLEKARLAVKKAREMISDAKESSTDSNRALEISTVLAKVAEDNYMMMSRKIGRAKDYVGKMKHAVKRASDKISEAQRAEKLATIRYTELKNSNSTKAAGAEQKIQMLKDTIATVKFTTAERLKEVKEFFENQEEVNSQLFKKPLAVNTERDAIVDKIDKHADRAVQEAQTEMKILQSERVTNATLAAEGGASKAIDAKLKQNVKEEESKAIAEIVKKSDKAVQAEQEEQKKADAAVLAAEKAASKVEEEAVANATSALEDLELKKAEASTPDQKKAIEENERAIRQQKRSAVRDAKQKVILEKKEAREQKRASKAVAQAVEEKANEQKAAAKDQAIAAEASSKDEATRKVQGMQADSELKKEEEAKLHKMSASERQDYHAKRSEHLLTKLWNIKDDIEKALHFQVKDKLKKLTKVAIEEKSKAIEKKVDDKQQEETKKIEAQVAAAENAQIEKREEASKIKARNAKRVAHKVEKMAKDETEYRKLAVGYRIPAKLMPPTLTKL